MSEVNPTSPVVLVDEELALATSARAMTFRLPTTLVTDSDAAAVAR
ncbi:hypothetical protein Pd630_LPD16044 (plasmid) [Rhodococcus opacus PD630]|nr:hypothetical protein Pd630_LPD16044 [Rhodococcus opacus PD630]